MNFFQFINQDKTNNLNNTKGRIISILFRIANFSTQNRYSKIILYPYLIFYKFLFEWILGIEIPYNTKIGPGLKIHHANSLIIHKYTIIGSNVTLRHSTTIGNSSSNGKCPIIEDFVSIGSNSVIIGDIIIGSNSIIGAGSVVVKSIPKNSVAVGNPAKVIKSVT